MKLIVFVLAFPVLLLMANTPSSSAFKAGNAAILTGNSTQLTSSDPFSAITLYDQWNLSSTGLSLQAFQSAFKGFELLKKRGQLNKTELLTIVDYSKPSNQQRLFVLNMKEGRLVFKSLVAHGRNSGYNYAVKFSNEAESHMTSLGFYTTGKTYTGANGYSLKLYGCEKGINDRAEERAIVFHGADYVNETAVRNKGYLGRSYGCPAVPVSVNKKIIDVIRNGSCLFLYHPTKKYMARSKILNS